MVNSSICPSWLKTCSALQCQALQFFTGLCKSIWQVSLGQEICSAILLDLQLPRKQLNTPEEDNSDHYLLPEDCFLKWLHWMHCFGRFIHLLTEDCTVDLIWQAVALESEGEEDTLLDICVAHAVYLWEERHLQLLCPGGAPCGEHRQTFGTVNKECADNKTLSCGIMLSALLKTLISFRHLAFFNCPTPFLLCEHPCILSQKVRFQQAPMPELTITQKAPLIGGSPTKSWCQLL